MLRFVFVSFIVLISVFLLGAGVYHVFERQYKWIENDCLMTFMFPNFFQLNITSSRLKSKYGLYLYLEGNKQIPTKSSDPFVTKNLLFPFFLMP